jgi:DNA (cytosine-5)-methyltransferase 1
MTAYYNEFNPYAAEWLRNLIDAGHVAPGLVDERSIEDVTPNDLAGFTQCHFFAGIGVWSYALRLAGWPDNKPAWSGSCPCQPFSTAGEGLGFADERHLWPTFHYLIEQRKPPVVFGEQVASKDGLTWIDLVQSDMEGTGYRFGAVDTCSAGFGAPHIRQRLWFVAERLGDSSSQGSQELRWKRDKPQGSTAAPDFPRRLGNTKREGLQGRIIEDIPGAGWREKGGELAGSSCASIGMADSEHYGQNRSEANQTEQSSDRTEKRVSDRGYTAPEGQSTTGPTNGFWRDSDWLFCRDGKWRPVRPGSFPLVDGAASRVGRLSAYGNAINAQAAKGFIESVMECQP